MINLGTVDGVLWPDDWTYTTADGKRSAQYEETLLWVSPVLGQKILNWRSLMTRPMTHRITETGVEVLTAGAKQEF